MSFSAQPGPGRSMADPAQETEERLEWADSMTDAMLRLPFPVTEARPAFVSKEQYSQVIELAASLTPKQRSKQKFTLLMPNGQKLTFRADRDEPRSSTGSRAPP